MTITNTPQAWSERAEQIQDPWKACRWSQESQQVRFQAVLAELDPQPGERLLDYGCGTGALTEHLSADVEYLGIDWAVGMVERAIREHPGRWFSQQTTGRFDLVSCIGPFNLSDGWTKEHTWHIIRWLWDTTGCRAFAACLYAGEDPDCLSYSQDELLRCGRTLTHDYYIAQALPNDLMLVARR